MDYPKFLEIIEVTSSEEANKYLKENWTLLSAGFHQVLNLTSHIIHIR